MASASSVRSGTCAPPDADYIPLDKSAFSFAVVRSRFRHHTEAAAVFRNARWVALYRKATGDAWNMHPDCTPNIRELGETRRYEESQRLP